MKKAFKTLSLVAMMMGAATAVQAAGDAEAGKGKAAVCAGCHGADGNSMIANFPKIAGQSARYTIKQLADIKSGARPVPEMAGIVSTMSDQDFADLAAFYEKLTPKVGKANPDLVELGQKIYRAGNADSGVAACAACHGATGQGMPAAGYPALSGQHAAYTEKQLKAFRAAGREDEAGARRENDGESKMMRGTAARLSDAEIKAVSSYINGLY